MRQARFPQGYSAEIRSGIARLLRDMRKATTIEEIALLALNGPEYVPSLYEVGIRRGEAGFPANDVRIVSSWVTLAMFITVSRFHRRAGRANAAPMRATVPL